MKLMKPLKLQDILDGDNLVELLDDGDRKLIANEIIEGFEQDKQSMGEWRYKANRYLKLADCDVGDRSIPWPGASNLCIPTIANACIASASRLYSELLRNRYPVETYVYGQHDMRIDPQQQEQLLEISNNLKDHILYQLRINEHCNWEQELYTLCYLFYVVGTVPHHKYYDESLKAYRFKALWPDQWAISADAEDVETARFSYCDKMYIADILDKINSNEIATYEYIENLDMDVVDLYEQREIVKQFVKLDLDGDGMPEPYCAIVDQDACALVKLIKNFYTETTEDIQEDGTVVPVSPQLELDEEGSVVGVKELTPIPYVTIYRMQDGKEGCFFKHGLAHRLYPINKAQNALINQILDIGTLQARQGAFIDQRARLPGGTKSLGLNQSMFVKPPPGMTIQQAIMNFPRSEISPVQYQIMEFLKATGDETGNVTEIMSGQVPDNTSPMIGMAAIQNSLLPFKTGYRLFLTSYNREMRSLGLLNYIYLDEEETFFLNDRQIAVTREMYNPKVTKVIPVADPTVSADSERYFQQAMLDGMIDRPESNDREILMRKLEISNIDNPERYLPSPNPNPPPSPEVEQMKATIMALEQQVNQQWKQIELKQKQLELKTAETEHKIKKERLELALKADKELSEQVERSAAAIRDIAEAEAAEAGSQLAQYEAVTQRLAGEANATRSNESIDGVELGGAEITGGNQGMEEQQDNQGIDELPGEPEL